MRFLDFICEMPYYQNKSLELIEGRIRQLSNHILKVWLMPESRDYGHWIKEIRNCLEIMDDSADTKTRNGRISHKALVKEFKNKIREQRVKNSIAGINADHSKNFKYNIKYYNALKDFYSYLWAKLAQEDFSSAEIIAHIEDLRNEI